MVDSLELWATGSRLAASSRGSAAECSICFQPPLQLLCLFLVFTCLLFPVGSSGQEGFPSWIQRSSWGSVLLAIWILSLMGTGTKRTSFLRRRITFMFLADPWETGTLDQLGAKVERRMELCLERDLMPRSGDYVAASLAAASGKLCLHKCCLPWRCLRWKSSLGKQLVWFGTWWEMLWEVKPRRQKCKELAQASVWQAKAAMPGPASSPGFETGSSQAFDFCLHGFSAFSHPSQNQFCRGTGAKPSKLIVLAFLLSNTEVFAEAF